MAKAAAPEEILPALHEGLPGATTATVVALYMDEPSAVLMHAGDSAAYAWNDGWQRLTPEQDVDQVLGLHPESFVARMERPGALLLVTDGAAELVAHATGFAAPDLFAHEDDASFVHIHWVQA